MPQNSDLNEDQVAAYCARQRLRQKELLQERLLPLKGDYIAPTALAEFADLSFLTSAIDLQLANHRLKYKIPDPLRKSSAVPEGVILRPGGVSGVPAPSPDPTGFLVGIRNKEELSIAEMIQGSRQRVWFAGYSQKYTFLTEANRIALADAAKRLVSLKFLITDPQSAATALRSQSSVYDDPEDLQREIITTVEAYWEFCAEFNIVDSVVQMRMTTHQPACSFFIIDELCYVSMYLQNVSGSVGPCLVFKSQSDTTAGYYELLSEEFLRSFAAADPLAP